MRMAVVLVCMLVLCSDRAQNIKQGVVRAVAFDM